MAYCPIVANYDVDSDQIGGHDVGFVDGENGNIRMINLTDAVGVVPENPQWCWKSKTDEDGVEREYLSTPAILWKRTPVYEKLKRDGVTGQSMEINVKDGKVNDGLFEINAFEFTAFCLLGDGIEPCFEGAQVQTFSADNLSVRMSEMMEDFKRCFSKVMAASADDNITPNGEQFTEGGEGSLNISELLQKYNLTADDVDFETDGMSAEEIEKRFAQISEARFDGDAGDGANDGNDGQGEDGEQEGTGDQGEGEDAQNGNDQGESPDDDDDAPTDTRRQFQLTGEQMRDGILDALCAIMYTDEWGSWPRYCYVDYDPVACEVYAYDNEDWNLYGFAYSMNGDAVVIDFDSKSRKKIAFVDFEGGDAQFSYKHVMDTATAKFEAVAGEVAGLREYKRGIENAERKAAEDEVFARFADIAEDERFRNLKDNCAEMSIQDIEDKCFAIRGRNVQMKFSMDNKPVRLPVDGGKVADADEPYGGVFIEFGIGR